MIALLLGCVQEEPPVQDSGHDTGETGDTGEPDPCAEPFVRFVHDDGAIDDVTGALLSGDYVTLDTPGTLEVCPSTWFARVLVRANVRVVGLGIAPEDTILSGGESGTILDVQGVDVTLSVSNVTLDRGAGLDEAHNSGGGGIYCADYASASVTDVVFTNNVANDGAGLYARDCTVDVARATFAGNVSDDDGGALTLWFSTATLTDVDFRDNVALDGGALAMFYSALTVTGGAFTDNTAGNFAGGVWVYDSEIALTGTTFSGNTNDGTQAGGLLVYGSAVLEDVHVLDNTGPIGGGLFVYWDSTVEADACEFAGNQPEDVWVSDYSEAGGFVLAVGDDGSFSCAENVCTSR